MVTQPSFVQSTLLNAPTGNWTSLQFGPDGRLYAAQVDGTIFSFTISATPAGYAVTSAEAIEAIASILNYNDDGTVAPAAYQGTRQITGLLVVPGTAGSTGQQAQAATPVTLYVTSSDPRIGAGPGGGDVNLDTNSGVISRLEQNADGSWTRIDLVRGLPRSEENHSLNGLQLSADGTKLYVAVGGNTNMGAPSNNFAYTPEYALSAAILVIDLAAIDAMPTQIDPVSGAAYKYDLPTLGGNPSDPYPEDPFGGFDGLNQAMLVPGGPVQIYSSGYRNPYDVVLTASGQLYTIDNGANAGWGNVPIGEGPATGGASTVTNKPNDGGSDTPDHLHLVTEGFYAGHPVPIRANPAGAGWYTDGSGQPVPNLPATWPPVPLSMANPAEGDYLYPGTDGALYTGWTASTNGLAEYTALGSFEGAMQGDLLAVSWDDQLYRIELTADGTQVVAVTKLTAGGSVLGGGLPLDVTAQGDGEIFAGSIWVANYGGPITIFTPGSTTPPPPVGDADGDGLADNVDPFAEDPANGRATDLASGQTLVWNFSQNIDPPGPNGLFNMGFTGLMANGTQSYLTLYDPAGIKPGGAAAGFQVEQVTPGDAYVANDQMNGFQFGLDVLPAVESFTIEVKIDNPFGGVPSTTPVNWKSQGFFIGTGDQDNYLKVVAAANGGAGGIEVATENSGTFASTMYAANITGTGIQTLDTITLKLLVDNAAGTATPSWSYTVGGSVFTGTGAAVALSGPTLQALQGTYSVAGTPSALAVGIISTSYGSGTTFPAYWESIRITSAGSPPPTDTAQARLSVTPGSALDASTYASGAFKVENLSGGGQELTTLTIDLGSAIFPGMIFDPTGQAGDQLAKGFTVDAAAGFTVTSFAFGGGSDTAGYSTLTLQLQDFDPGEVLLFSVDVDPASIQGVVAPGPGEAGSVAGVELTGATIGFDFGTTRLTNTLFKEAGSPGGATTLAVPGLPPQPSIAIAGITGTTATVTAPQQTVVVTGAANTTARVLVAEGAQYTAGVPAAAPDLGPYEANSAVQVTTYDVVLDSTGKGQVQVALASSVPEGGLNLITAAALGANGATGPAAAPVVLKLGQASTALTVAQSDGTTTVTEGGATDTLALSLSSQPAADVSITITGSPDVSVSAGGTTPGNVATLTFTPQNWNTTQIVTVTAIDDAVAEPAETAALTFASLSDDPAFNGLSLPPVQVTVTDNDQTSNDADGDGLSDSVDRFALDATNGSGRNLAQLGSLRLDFATAATPFAAGFTGVMANGSQAYGALATDGTVANGTLTMLAGPGDPYMALNSQKNAYQFGVDSAGVQQFTVETRVVNPFAGGIAAENYRSVGLQIGAGDQDNYAKLVFTANGGAGGIEFLTEVGGTPSSATSGLGVPLGNIASAMLYLDVTQSVLGATATPRWTLHDSSGAQIGSGSGTAQALGGALLDAVQGDLLVAGQQSELAVGVIATSYASSGPISASWDYIAISSADLPPPPSGLTVTQSGGSTAIAEGGMTDAITLVLASQPSTDVAVTVSGTSDIGLAADGGTPGLTATLVFTPQNWNVARTVTVAAVDDTAVEGPETASLTFATISADARYNALVVPAIPVSIADNDTAPTNRAPVATTDRWIVTANTNVALGSQAATANDTDPDGNPLSIVAVAPGSSTGPAVSYTADGFTFSSGAAGRFAFQYSLGDGTTTSLGTVEVEVVPSGSGTNGTVVDIPTLLISLGWTGYEASYLSGSSRTDRFTGGQAADIILAGQGNDIITASGGADTLRGGQGSDTFRFLAVGDGTDLIQDFAKGNTPDTLDLQLLFGTLGSVAAAMSLAELVAGGYLLVDTADYGIGASRADTRIRIDTDGAAGTAGPAELAYLLDIALATTGSDASRWIV